MGHVAYTVRLAAKWQREPDDRLLEVLKENGWMTPYSMAMESHIHLTTTGVKRRLRILADAELVAPSDDDYDLFHLTTDGRLYLDGERDQELHPHPFYYGLATAPLV